MDEFDEFAGGGQDGSDGFDEADMDDAGPSSAFEDFDEAEDPADLDAFDFSDEETHPDLEAELDDVFDDGFESEFDENDFDDEPPAAPDDTAYAATYEDALVDQADNPAVFPPELDVDVPEPVDGYPWVDLDTLGQAETEPWMNTTDTSDYAAADLDDVASEALSRFWQQPM